jgi:hypothetical protein
MNLSQESKYKCQKCSFNCEYLSILNQHLESKKHNETKRKERNDKILEPKCNLCSYETNKTTNMKVHRLTKHSSKEDREKEFKFYCNKCDFGTFIKILFDRHLETLKHNT